MSGILKITLKARDQMTKTLGGAAKASGKLSLKLAKIGAIGATIGTVIGAWKFKESFIEANSQLEQMKFRMDALLGSSERGDGAFHFIRQFQRDNPISSIKALTSAFEDLINAGMDPADGSLESLITGAKKFGLTDQSIGRVTLALKQMAAGINLQGQELNQLAEQIPGITKKLAKELNIPLSEFKESMQKRLIGGVEAAAAVVRILGKEGEGVAKAYAQTWEAKIIQIQSLWFDLMTKVGEGGGFKKAKDILDQVIDIMKNKSGEIIAFFNTMIFGFTEVMNSVIKGFNQLDFQEVGKLWINVFTNVVGLLKKAVLYTRIMIENSSAAFKPGGLIHILTGGGSESASSIKARSRLTERRSQLDKEIKEIQGYQDKFIKDYKKSEEEFAKKVQLANQEALFGKNEDGKHSMQDVMGRAAMERYKRYLSKVLALSKERASINKQLFGDNGKTLEMLKNDIDKVDGEVADTQKKLYANLKNGLGKGKELTAEFLQIYGAGGTKGFFGGGKMKDINEVKTFTEKFTENWVKGIDTVGAKFKDVFATVQSQGEFMAETVTRSMERSFSRFFDDLIDGKIVKLKDAILGFLKDIARALSRALSNRLATGILTGLATAFTPKTTNSGGVGSDVFAGTQGSSGFSSGGFDDFRTPQIHTKASGMKVEIINQSGEQVEAKSASMSTDYGAQIMSIVIDSVRTNRGGSRTALKAGLT